MLLELLLGLRDGRERVSVIQEHGSARAALGIRRPQDDERRAVAARLGGGDREAPRRQEQASIDEPAPLRTQTVLYYSVPRQIQKMLNGEVTDALPASRRAAAGRVTVGLRVD